MKWGTRAELGSVVGLVTLLASCAPTVAAVPCNEDEDCQADERCLRGVCAEGHGLGPRPDAGTGGSSPLDDGGPLPTDAGDDAGSPLDDGGSPRDDGGSPLEDGGSLPSDAGDDGGEIIDPGPPGIVSFTASPATVDFGGSVTLAWTTLDVSSCALEGSDAIIGPSGSLVIERPASRRYLLSCVGEDGERYEEEVTVVVECGTTISIGTLQIGSDAELALFPSGGCVEVTGHLEIRNISGTDLLPLYGLRAVARDFSIGESETLERLDGLELLRSVGGDLRLGFAPGGVGAVLGLSALTSVHGLGGLESVGADLEIRNATSLRSLAGLERLRTIDDDFDVQYSPVLESLASLRRLEHIGTRFELRRNDALRELGLPALTSIGGGILLDHVPVEDLHALSNLSGELFELYVHNCHQLTSLEGLEGVTGFRSNVRVQFNDALASLAGLESVTHASRVTVRRNAALESAALPSLERVDHTSPAECAQGYCDGDLSFERNAALAQVDLPALTYVRRNLDFIENHRLETLSGFEALDHVRNDVIIRGNASLRAVEGFEALRRVDDLLVEDNPALETFRLERLEEIDDDLLFRNNDALVIFDGFPRLLRIGGDLEVLDNERLAWIAPAPISDVGDYPECVAGCRLHVRNNPQLPFEQVLGVLEQVQRPVDAADEANIDVTGNAP